ncbi:aminopeptidase P family protein [Jannaschia sp. LMIT008]|uniref:aminopeptidase P family protein n=1 Tax=Jannaschia maritima TaxID=3032585 RepID=UPI0028128E32|nr:aminopeptidase P family protein [Jannaschia sp. LMIT008]
MFQTFDTPTDPAASADRIAALRGWMADRDLDAILIPRADAHQGEYVAARDEQLAWATGFTGSAGFAVVMAERAALFTDGRYTLQVRQQSDAAIFEYVDWPATSLTDWLKDALPRGRLGLDPMLHTIDQVAALRKLNGVEVVTDGNGIPDIWTDRPDRPAGTATAWPVELAGKGDETKRAEIAGAIRDAGATAAVLTLPDGICWLLNIRGTDLPRYPVVQCFAVIHDDARVDLFTDPGKFDDLGPDPAIALHDWDAFLPALSALDGPVLVDPATAPHAVATALGDTAVIHAPDPCALPKACKTDAELDATREAHLRDGAAMVRFLHWLDTERTPDTTEIDVVRALEGFRRDTNALRDLSFDTICGSGPHGAIVHYRVTETTNRTLDADTVLLVDSGGQYLDGTTDITRTVPLGDPPHGIRHAFTRVLQGMVAISRARFPKGVAGCHLDALARAPLWAEHRDYDHGTGHGVGVYLGVHEGPQRLSRASTVPLRPGMIVSNEPGYYRTDEYGIRIENLVVVQPMAPPPDGDARDMMGFDTLTYVPIDRRLIVTALLSRDERDWIDAYHAQVLDRVGPRVDGAPLRWLRAMCTPLDD